MNPLQATGGVSPFKPLWRALANTNVCFDYHIALSKSENADMRPTSATTTR